MKDPVPELDPKTSPTKNTVTLGPVDFIKKVGKGKTLSQHLSALESLEAFSALLTGTFTAAQTGAFLQALRINELSLAELNGLSGVFRARTAVMPALPGERTLVLNLASDTARKGGLASLLAAQLLARFGVGVGLVRSTPVLSGNGASFEETWELARSWDLGIAPALSETGSLVAGLSALDGIRRELGFRSCLHTAEKLVNPWAPSPLLLGISHKHYALRLAETMVALGQDGAIILGNHGTVDLVLHKETEMVTVAGGKITETSVSPTELGLELSPEIYTLAKFPQWREWLASPRDNGLLQAVQYHLAVFLWLAGGAPHASAAMASIRAVLPKLLREG